MEAAEQIRELTKLLEEANYQYYVLDDPKMEDYEYDRLMRQLEELEARSCWTGRLWWRTAACRRSGLLRISRGNLIPMGTLPRS